MVEGGEGMRNRTVVLLGVVKRHFKDTGSLPTQHASAEPEASEAGSVLLSVIGGEEGGEGHGRQEASYASTRKRSVISSIKANCA